MSSASVKVRTGMLSPGQSWTDFMPASRSMQTRVLRRQRLEQRGLAATARTEDRHRGFAGVFGEPFVGGDDAKGHHAPPLMDSKR